MIREFLFLIPLALTAAPADEPPREWVDPSTGHRVIRLSDEPGSASLYFHQNAYTASGDKMVFSTREGLSTVNLTTRKIEPLVEGRAGQVVVGRKTRQVFYTRDGSVYATHLDTRATREITKLPPEIRGGSGLAVNADETLLAGSYVAGGQRPAPPAPAQDQPQSQGPGQRPAARERGLEARWAARLPMRLYTINIKTGEVKTFHSSTDWLNHVQFSPTDPTLIMFCHEGPWHKVDRIWTIRTDGTELQKIHTRTMDMEIAGHEFFSADGKIIWCDLQTPRGEDFWVGGYVIATGERIYYHLQRDEWSVHFNVSPDGKLFAGDGGGPGMVAHAKDGQWIYLFRPEMAPNLAPEQKGLIKPGVFRSERLVNMAKHDYRLEPNVSFTPDAKWIVFRSNMHGASHVYAVEINKKEARGTITGTVMDTNKAMIPAVPTIIAGLALLVSAGSPTLTELQRAFQNPPDDSKIMMRWWWFGPAVTKPELEREMRLMKEGGIGGFEVQPVYPLSLDDPASDIKNLPFLSDEFIEALRFTSEKARQLGLRMDLTLGSGWPYGGPQVPISQAAGRLRHERVKVEGTSRRVPVPNTTAGEKLLAVFLVRAPGQSTATEGLREITDIKDGAVQLPEGLQGPHEVLFFISSRTGMMVKRPAVGAEGFVLDHYDCAAINNYLKQVGDRLMGTFGSRPPYAIFCDSLEVFQSDWTGDFLEEFRKRRGYDLKPHLPALMMDVGPKTGAIRHDWGQTLTELLNERFLAPMREWSQRNHTRFRIQGYGIPPAALSSNALADLPEGEGPQWKIVRASRWASSASHLYGRPVTSSETWTWLHSPVFRATPLDVKAEADLHFLQGINQLIGHGWPYTAEGVEYPGWRFYAAGVFNEKNPWWIVMPDLSLYLQRLSFLLRQGQPSNDVAIYLPNSDAWASFSAGRVHMIESLRERIGPDVVARVLEAGFNFDFFDDEALARLGRVEKGALMVGANRYKAVILPGVEYIPLDTFQKLEEFARNGGVLIATRRLPALTPGFMATEAGHGQIREISRRLFEAPSAPAHFVQDEDGQLGSKLAALLRPDMLLSPAVSDIGFIHRRSPDAEIYFVANTGNVSRQVQATFRVQGMQAEWWNPFSGVVSSAESEAQSAARFRRRTSRSAAAPPSGVWHAGLA